jgi:molybdopterin-guanine dinucleotide biosynthesis protein A
MSNQANHINGYILAGGKSSRMGMDKGLMMLNGKPVIQFVIEQLQPVVKKIVIVSNNPEYKKFGFEVIADLIKDIGPAGGIYTALNHTDTELNFMVSCDMPFITKDAIEFIFQNIAHSQIILPVHHGKTEPLFGIYSKDCLVKWFELIQQGTIKLQDIILHFRSKKINVENNVLFNDLLFMNINTKNDFENAFNLTKNGN